MVQNYPSFFSGDEGNKVGEVVSLEDIEGVLKILQKPKVLALMARLWNYFLNFFMWWGGTYGRWWRNPDLKVFPQGL